MSKEIGQALYLQPGCTKIHHQASSALATARRNHLRVVQRFDFWYSFQFEQHGTIRKRQIGVIFSHLLTPVEDTVRWLLLERDPHAL